MAPSPGAGLALESSSLSSSSSSSNAQGGKAQRIDDDDEDDDEHEKTGKEVVTRTGGHTPLVGPAQPKRG